MLSPKQQAFELINKGKNILIVLPRDHSADNLGAGLALTMLCQEMGKKIDFIVQEPVARNLSFLPGLKNIKSELTSWRDFIISIDTSQKKIKQLRYETVDSTLKIFLAGPDKLEQKDIRLDPGPFFYDALITIGAPDLEALGPFYEKYTEIFFEKPILNIDNQAGNEYFGEINLVEPTASSSAEILADFFNSFFPSQINPDIATCLLAGIIAQTHSFQKINTGPQTFSLASLLMTQGAEREKIVHALYKTKPLNYLRLWGRLLARLEWQQDKNLAWVTVEKDDFIQTDCRQEDLPLISEEINELLPQLTASIILWLDETDLPRVLVQSANPGLLQKLNLELNGSLKNNRAFLKILENDLAAAKSKIASLLNSFL